MPNWLASLLSAAAGAFFAAWAGAQLGFRRVKKERALERRIGWHEETIQALAKYEEKLDRVHKHSRNEIIVQRVKRGVTASGVDDLPKTFKVQAALWAELGMAEERARAALRLGDLYTDLETQVACSTALSTTVNVVASQWIDIAPEPEISWVDLHSKIISTGSLLRISPKPITRFGPKRLPVSVHGDQPFRRMSITGGRMRTRG